MKLIPNWIKTKISRMKHRVVIHWCKHLGLTPVMLFEKAGTLYIRSQKDGSLHRIGAKERSQQAKQTSKATK